MSRRTFYRLCRYGIAFTTITLLILYISKLLLTKASRTAAKTMEIKASNFLGTSISYKNSEALYALINDPVFKPTSLGGSVKVYVYSLPQMYNLEQLQINSKSPPKIWDPNCTSNFYSLEVSFHRFLLQSSYLTTDPWKADYFYVPSYSSCYLINNHPNNLNKTEIFHRGLLHHIKTTYRYFNVSQGRDHVWMFSQGFGAKLFGNWRVVSNGIFLVHNGQFTLDEFTPHKDIAVPPDLTGYNFSSYFELKPSERPRKRWLAHFGGTVNPSHVKDEVGKLYSKGVRQYIKKHFSSNPDFRITGTRVNTYIHDMMSSVFCLCPEGWHAWNPRPYQAVLLGCIPVLLSEEIELAFEDFLDYSKFMVRILPQDVKDLDRILKSIAAYEVQAMQEELSKVWRFFSYDKHGVAHNMILEALDRKRTVQHVRRKYRNLQSYSYSAK